jgi:hypothetical protein
MSIYAYAVSLEIIVMSLVVSVYMFLFSKLTFKELHQFFLSSWLCDFKTIKAYIFKVMLLCKLLFASLFNVICLDAK